MDVHYVRADASGVSFTMSIRSYRDSDFQAILDIYSSTKLDELRFEAGDFEIIPLDKDQIRFQKFFDSDVYVYDTGNVIAYCALNESNIEAIYVLAEFRRTGIAKKLLEFLLAKTEDDVSLNVAKHNLPAKKLYQKYGFEVENEFSTSYNGVKAVATKMVRKKMTKKFKKENAASGTGARKDAGPF